MHYVLLYVENVLVMASRSPMSKPRLDHYDFNFGITNVDQFFILNNEWSKVFVKLFFCPTWSKDYFWVESY
jgi:hypothetical protein